MLVVTIIDHLLVRLNFEIRTYFPSKTQKKYKFAARNFFLRMAQTNSRSAICLGSVYDIIAQSISVLDVTTDIWVCITFYLDDRKTFFSISLTILLLALISYTAAFVKFFSDSSRTRDRVRLFLLALPFSPLLPFAFFHAKKSESCFGRLFDRCGIRIRNKVDQSTSKKASKFKQFFEKKIQKHFGFILESLVEGILRLYSGLPPF